MKLKHFNDNVKFLCRIICLRSKLLKKLHSYYCNTTFWLKNVNISIYSFEMTI